jgi:hypothetical protein
MRAEEVDLVLKDVEGFALNLTNRPKAGVELPAYVHAIGRPAGGGTFELETQLDPLADTPTFKIDASLESIPLPSLNDFLRAYGNIDAEGGKVSIYSELAVAQGAFQGYVKPLFKDIEVAKWRPDESLGRRVWEHVVQLASKILENRQEKRVATKIPVRGRFDKAEPDLWAAIGALLRNAFVQALLPGIEGSIGLPRHRSNKDK